MKSKITKIILVGFVSFNSLLLTAQDNPISKNIKLKLYVNGFYQAIENNDYNGISSGNLMHQFENKKYDIGALSFAVEIGSYKKLKHEIELMPVKFDYDNILHTITRIEEDRTLTATWGEKITSFKAACRYQINYYFIQNKNVMPYFGLSSQFFYEVNRIKPSISIGSITKDQFWGLLFAITPSVIFNVTKKLSIDLNIPVGLYDIKINSEKIDNSAYPEHNGTTSKIIGEFIPKTLNIRLGICYNL